MTDLVFKDPFRRLFAGPRWIDDFEDTFTTQRGLKIYESDESIIAEAVVAGVPADKVDVHIEDGVLTIKAISQEEKKSKSAFKSASYQYYYTAALSGGQWDKAKAETDNGVVKVTIPKTKATKPKKIKVSTKAVK